MGTGFLFCKFKLVTQLDLLTQDKRDIIKVLLA